MNYKIRHELLIDERVIFICESQRVFKELLSHYIVYNFEEKFNYEYLVRNSLDGLLCILSNKFNIDYRKSLISEDK